MTDEHEIKSLMRTEIKQGESIQFSLQMISYLKTAFLQKSGLWQEFLDWRNGLISEVTGK